MKIILIISSVVLIVMRFFFNKKTKKSIEISYKNKQNELDKSNPPITNNKEKILEELNRYRNVD